MSNVNYDPQWGAVSIRRAVAGDRSALRTLAELDSALPLTDRVLLGELRGRPVAALDLSDGTVVADPFIATAEIVELLRLRARQIDLRGSATGHTPPARRERRVPSQAWAALRRLAPAIPMHRGGISQIDIGGR